MPVDWIGSSDDRAASIELGEDTSLGDSDGLLFHNFVNSDTISIIHFIKLIDADNTTVSEDHGACFETALTSVLVSDDSSGKTDTGRTTTSGGDDQRCDVHDCTEKLRFSDTRVSDHEAIDVTTEMGTVRESAFTTTSKEQDKSFLNPVIAINRRSQRSTQLIHQVGFCSEVGDVVVVFLSEGGGGGISREKGDSGSDDKSTEDTRDGALGVGRDGFVDTNSGDSVTGLGGVTKVTFNDELNRARKLTRRGSFREFLNGDLLVIDVGGEAELSSEQVVLLVTGGVDSRSGETTVGSDVTVLT
jgi:hypothetical protein